MGHTTTETTVWPTSVELDPSIKDLIGLFYALADDKSSDAGPRMAREVFSKDAFMGAATGGFNGSEEISRSRDNAWKTVSSRRHSVFKVFVNDAAGHELVVLGKLNQVMINGKELVLPFTGHLVVDAESHAAGTPRLKHMQAYADTAPVVAALKD